MATIYVDQGATGANNGTSITDAYTDPNSITQSAGDIIRIVEGTYNITWTLQGSGTSSAPVKVVAINSSDVEYGYGDGAKVIFDAQSTRAYGINANTFEEYIWFNVGVINSTANGFDSGGAVVDNHMFNDCEFSNNSNAGIGVSFRFGQFIHCLFTGNDYGLMQNSSCSLIDCCFKNQTVYDVQGGLSQFITRCLFVGSPIGVYYVTSSSNAIVKCCTFVGYTTAALSNGGLGLLVQDCMFHSCAINVENIGSADMLIKDNNSTYNATSTDPTTGRVTEIRPYIVESSDPFINKAGGDYMLTAGSLSRNLERKYDSNNTSYFANGALEPEEAASSGGIFTPKQRIHGV